MTVTVVETTSLGDRTYLIDDGETAVVVDPQRDIDRVLTAAARRGVRISTVAETHLHNDYVSGGLSLARVTGAQYVVAAAEQVYFPRVEARDGDEIPVSDRLRLRVIATPGHTFHHLSYAAILDGTPIGVCTGGSLLFGATGRTDLLGGAHTEPLAHAQHASARRLAELLPDEVPIWPTHGFGSFCSVTPTDAVESTLGREREVNPVFRLRAGAYVSQLVDALGAYPAYYAHMGARNAAGAALIDLTPVRRADAKELHDRIGAGEWVVDLRTRKAYAHRHLAGTLSFGVDGPLATWLGWLLPYDRPLTLLGESAAQIAEAQRELARIGVDRPAAAATGTPEDWSGGHEIRLRSMRTGTFADLAAARPRHVLDVRTAAEWRDGHLAGAVHVPLPELPAHIDSLPDDGTEIWTHCAAGYRAAAAASLLLRAGRRAVHVDDEWANAAVAGLRVVAQPES